MQFSWDALTDCCGSEGKGAVVNREFAGRVGSEEDGGGEGEREERAEGPSGTSKKAREGDERLEELEG